MVATADLRYCQLFQIRVFVSIVLFLSKRSKDVIHDFLRMIGLPPLSFFESADKSHRVLLYLDSKPSMGLVERY